MAGRPTTVHTYKTQMVNSHETSANEFLVSAPIKAKL